jgi:type IX secretion system PorP/SprF family membrane protein
MKTGKIHIIFLFLLLPLVFKGQQYPLTTQYLFNPYALAPSMAGVTGFSEIFLNYRAVWTGVDGNPRTMRFNGFGDIYNQKLWLGGSMYMDKTDILGRFNATLSLTYKLKLYNEQFLYLGGWANFYQNIVNYTDAVGVDPNDPLFSDPSKIAASKFNAGFGINYQWRDLNVGFAFPTLFNNNHEVKNGQGIIFAFKREFLFHVSYLFSLNENCGLQTYAVFRKTVNEPLSMDLSAMFIIKHRFWTGLLFRNSGVIALNLGGNIVGGLVFNYSYEIGVGKMNLQSGGSHEITLGWRFGYKSNKYFNNYKSKRKTEKQKNNYRNNYPPIYDYYIKK